MLQVFVPRPGSLPCARIHNGSAIVGLFEEGEETVLVDFEGNLYGASNIVNFADRVFIAASRHLDRAPTISRARFNCQDLLMIGYWDHDDRRLTINPELRHELDYWVRHQLPDRELIPSCNF